MLLGLVMFSQNSYAGISDKFHQYIGSEFSSASGFYIVLSVLGAGVIAKLIQHFFMNEKENTVSRVKISHHHHHRQRIIKKTS